MICTTRNSPSNARSKRDAEIDLPLDLGETGALLIHVVNAIPNPVFAKDEQHRFVFFNDAFCAFLGRSRAELLGRSDFDFVPAEEAQVFWDKDAAVLATGQPNENEEALTDAAGVRHWIVTRKSLLTLPGGGRYLVVVITDISERKRAEEDLRAAKIHAEAANRAKDAFLANMSHELRTPLNAVIGFSDIMSREMFGPLGNDNYRSYAADINGCGQHLLAIIDEILDYSKIEAGTLDLRETVFDLRRVLSTCVRLLQQRVTSGGVAVRLALPEALPSLYADEIKLKQVLLNLLSNAIKFTRSGGHVTLAARRGRGEGLEIEVTDTGMGMKVEDIPIALEPFRQLDDGLARAYEGAGLGLSLARALVELHGGTLAIDSAPRTGTRVTIILPKARVRA